MRVPTAVNAEFKPSACRGARRVGTPCLSRPVVPVAQWRLDQHSASWVLSQRLLPAPDSGATMWPPHIREQVGFLKVWGTQIKTAVFDNPR